MISILVAGKKGLSYNRTRVLIQGLEKLEEVKVSSFEFGKKNGETGNKLNELSADVDYILVPAFRHTDVKFVKKYSNKPVIFDPLISNYLTKVVDYQHWWKAPSKYFSDFFPMHQADILIADTEHHKLYFSKTFKIPLERIVVVPVGVTADEFLPKEKEATSSPFRVGFYGSFVPLQGAEKIALAAKELKQHADIEFHLIGSGATFKETQKIVEKHNLSNVHFPGWLEYDDLAAAIQSFDVCLGIFGDSKKADFVVPNKVYHYGAMGKCIISKDTPGIREVFEDQKNILLCTNSPSDIAKAILELKENDALRKHLGEQAHALISMEYNEMAIAKRLVDFLQN